MIGVMKLVFTKKACFQSLEKIVVAHTGLWFEMTAKAAAA